MRRRFLLLPALALLTACRGGPNPFAPTGPQDCLALSRMTWTLFLYDASVPLPVGHSRKVSLSPNVEAVCAASIVSVVWQVDAPSVASVVPRGTPDKGIAWVTGASPGATAVRARVVFGEGGPQETRPLAFDVTAPPAHPNEILVTEGVLDLPPIQPGTPRGFFSFTVPADNVEITVDWVSPLNDIDFSLFRGICSTVPCGGAIVGGVRNPDVKPRVIAQMLSAGDYTVRVDNLGPSAETVRYAVHRGR